MKKYLLLPLVIAGLMTLPGCATDDGDARVHTSTTTTEESRMHHQPAATSTTTETRAVRTY